MLVLTDAHSKYESSVSYVGVTCCPFAHGSPTFLAVAILALLSPTEDEKEGFRSTVKVQ